MGFVFLTAPFISWLAEISIHTGNLAPWALGSILFQVLFIAMLVYWGTSPGKYLMRLEVVDKQGRYPAWSKAVMRCLIPLLIGLVMFLEFRSALDGALRAGLPLTELNYGLLRKTFDKNLEWIIYGLGIAFWLDAAVLLLNPQRRALHDFWAGSFVVRRGSE